MSKKASSQLELPKQQPEPSKQQRVIFANIKSGVGHSVFVARAGSGKTKTIEMSLDYLPPNVETFLTAFNKEIADELKSRVGSWTRTVSTLHSYGNRALTATFGRLNLNPRRTGTILSRMLAGRVTNTFSFRIGLEDAVDKAKNMLATTEAEIEAILDRFAIPVEVPDHILPTGAKSRDVFVRYVLDILDESQKVEGDIDWTDMIWLPVVRKIKVPKFERVFIDETQDLNPAQMRLALRACSKKRGGRVHAVGDDRQALYAWRGADHDAVHTLIRKLKADVLPLTTCYRCATKIIDEARIWVPDINPAPWAKEGSVVEMFEHDMLLGAGPGDFILSRTNAPLMRLCLKFVTQGRRAAIQGADVGRTLATFVKASSCESIYELKTYVEKWRGKEVGRLKANNPKADTSTVEDKAECILTLCEQTSSVSDLLATIQSMFTDGDDLGRITLSTVHKSKGLERDRVWLITKTFRTRSEYWQQFTKDAIWVADRLAEAKADIQEANIHYVAVTRARTNLIYVKP